MHLRESSMKKQHRFGGKRCCGHHRLLNSGDYQMGGNGAGATGQGGDGQRFGGSVRISHRQDGVSLGGFHNRHANDLGGAGCAAGHRISQICAVQGQNQLSGFGYAYLEQHLIGADFRQSERIRTGPDNVGSTVRSVLREADKSEAKRS